MNVWLDEVDESDLSFWNQRCDEDTVALWTGCDSQMLLEKDTFVTLHRQSDLIWIVRFKCV